MIGKKIIASVVVCGAVILTAMAWAQSPKRPALESTVFDWSQVRAEATKYGAKRQVLDGSTTSLARLECHATTLNPGETTHPPRRQPDEELVIVKDGTIEAQINDQPHRAEAGSVIFVKSNDLYGVRNPTDTPATYYVVKWLAADAAAK
jgi:XRE family transcriptional regulator, regulator of sulfur utilization